MSQHSPAASAPVNWTERRKTPRFEAHGRLVGQLVREDLPVRVRDVGLGGFSIETMEPIETGKEHIVRFVAPDDWSATLTARSAHCRPSCAEDGSPLFVTGFAFVEAQKPEMRRKVETLVEKVTSVRLYGN